MSRTMCRAKLVYNGVRFGFGGFFCPTGGDFVQASSELLVAQARERQGTLLPP